MPAGLLSESKIIKKVNSKGEINKRLKCKSGFKLAPDGRSCIPISGSEKAQKKKSIRKAMKTIKSRGDSFRNKIEKKKKKALKKRKALGL